MSRNRPRQSELKKELEWLRQAVVDLKLAKPILPEAARRTSKPSRRSIFHPARCAVSTFVIPWHERAYRSDLTPKKSPVVGRAFLVSTLDQEDGMASLQAS